MALPCNGVAGRFRNPQPDILGNYAVKIKHITSMDDREIL